MGDNGKFDNTGVPSGAPPSGAGMENYGATTKRVRLVHRDRVSGSYLEDLCIHHVKSNTFLHHPSICTSQFQTGERYGDSNLCGESVSAACGAIQ